MTFLARIRLAILILLLLAMAAAAPAHRPEARPGWRPQSDGERRRSSRRCCKQVPRIEGRIDIPDTKAAVLIQPAGRTWDYFHEVLLHWGGAIVILGTIALLGIRLSDHGTASGSRRGARAGRSSASRPLSDFRIG